MPALFSILVGCYDGTLHGWQTETEEATNVELAFAFRAHDTCVRTVAVSGKLACTASTDESIQTYDVVKRKVADRMLGVHQDEVTALSFSVGSGGSTFLLSGDREGRIYVWSTSRSGGDCRVIHELKGHKQSSPVTSIAVHPSGKIALSTAKDNSLRMWDLTLGKAAPRTKLEDFAELGLVCWSPTDGARYGLVGDEYTVLVFDTLSGSETPIGVYKHPKRVNALCFCEDVVLASACDDGALRTLGADGSLLREFRPTQQEGVAATAGLIRARDCRSVTVGGQVLLIGAFSDNTVRVWDVAGEDDEAEIKILHVGSRAHITCMGVFAQDEAQQEQDEAEYEQAQKQAKRARLADKKKGGEDDDDEEEEEADSEAEQQKRRKPVAAAAKAKQPAAAAAAPSAAKKDAKGKKPPQQQQQQQPKKPAAAAAQRPKDDIIYVKQSHQPVPAVAGFVQPVPTAVPTNKKKNNKKRSG